MSLIILLVVAFFVFWRFVPQKQKGPPKPAPRYRRDARVSAKQLEWQRFAEEHCESPAEVAFIRAMINSFGLRPQLGSLVSEGVRLDFQVEEGRYRVDFLVNHWLVVEIDGAAYHSSPEAKLRDGSRDRFFEKLGYSVLRIPAKIVFQDPKFAVKQVKSALSVGRRVVVAHAPVSRNGFAGLAERLELVEKQSKQKQAIHMALADATESLSAEESALDSALRLASTRMEISRLDAEALERFRSVGRYLGEATGQLEPPTVLNLIFKPFCHPKLTGDDWVDGHVSDRFVRLEKKRKDMLSNASARLEQSPEIRPYVKSALDELGRGDIWENII